MINEETQKVFKFVPGLPDEPAKLTAPQFIIILLLVVIVGLLVYNAYFGGY